MTSPPSIPPTDPQTPWLGDDHWKAGDKAWWIFPTETGISRTMVEIVDPAEGTVRDPRVIYNDGVFQVGGKFERIRHRDNSCTACAHSVLELFAAERHDPLDTKGAR